MEIKKKKNKQKMVINKEGKKIKIKRSKIEMEKANKNE